MALAAAGGGQGAARGLQGQGQVVQGVSTQLGARHHLRRSMGAAGMEGGDDWLQDRAGRDTQGQGDFLSGDF